MVLAITAGLTYGEIATKLHLGYESVKEYAARVRTKLGLHSKVQIAMWAVQHKLVKIDGRTNAH